MKRIFILLLLTISLNAVAQELLHRISNNTLMMQHCESTTFSLVMPSIRQLQ